MRTGVNADTFVQSTRPVWADEIGSQMPRKDPSEMNALETLAVVALVSTSTFAQSAASLAIPIENKPADRLYVEDPEGGVVPGRP